MEKHVLVSCYVMRRENSFDWRVAIMASTAGFRILPRDRSVAFDRLEPALRSTVISGSEPFKKPDVMIYVGAADECSSWLSRVDERPRRVIVAVDQLLETPPWFLRAVDQTCICVLAGNSETKELLQEKGIKAFLPEEVDAIVEAIATDAVKAPSDGSSARLCVVIPASQSVLEKALEQAESVRGQLTAEDAVIVSYQRNEVGQQTVDVPGVINDAEVVRPAWNMSRARNVGIQYAITHGFDLVSFLDVDLEASSEYADTIKSELPTRTPAVWVPMVRESDPMLKTRPGSGVCAVPVFLAQMLDGFDELFVGGGAEDVDFLERAELLFGARAVISPLVLKHESHEPRGDRERWDRINELRLRGKKEGVIYEFKSCLQGGTSNG